MAGMEDLKVYTEEEMTKNLIIPLLEELDFEAIQYVHGPHEMGKDVIFRVFDKFNLSHWCCIQVKADKVSGNTREGKHLSGLDQQAIQTFKSPYTSHSHGRIRIDRLYIIAHSFTSNAKKIIQESLYEHDIKKQVKFLNGKQLIRLLEENAIRVEKEERYKERLQEIRDELGEKKILEEVIEEKDQSNDHYDSILGEEKES